MIPIGAVYTPDGEDAKPEEVTIVALVYEAGYGILEAVFVTHESKQLRTETDFSRFSECFVDSIEVVG